MENKILKNLPNILSWTRLALSPFLLIPILLNDRILFFTMFVFLGLTDIADGVIARKLGFTSEYGRKIDSYADYVWASLGAIAFLMFFGQEMIKIPSVPLLIGGSYLIPLVIALVKLKGVPQLHLVANKITGVAFSIISPVFVFFEFNAKLMWVLTFFLVIAGIDRGLFYFFLRDKKDFSLRSSLELLKKLQTEKIRIGKSR